MKKLTINEVTIGIKTEHEHTPISGNVIQSGDNDFDTQVENEIIERLDGGDIWAWCNVEVKLTYKGLSASEFLGCCSYKDLKEFKTGGYYDDMVSACLQSLETQIKDLVNTFSGAANDYDFISEIIQDMKDKNLWYKGYKYADMLTDWQAELKEAAING